jgi:hypothetical protein
VRWTARWKPRRCRCLSCGRGDNRICSRSTVTRPLPLPCGFVRTHVLGHATRFCRLATAAAELGSSRAVPPTARLRKLQVKASLNQSAQSALSVKIMPGSSPPYANGWRQSGGNLPCVRCGLAHARFVGRPQPQQAELELIRAKAIAAGASDAVLSNHWAHGGAGAADLARAMVKTCETPADFKLLYPLELTIEEKIEIIVKRIYRGDGIEISEKAAADIARFVRVLTGVGRVRVLGGGWEGADSWRGGGARSSLQLPRQPLSRGWVACSSVCICEPLHNNKHFNSDCLGRAAVWAQHLLTFAVWAQHHLTSAVWAQHHLTYRSLGLAWMFSRTDHLMSHSQIQSARV